MNMCIPMSHQRSWFTCLLHIVVSVHPLQEAVLLCIFLCGTAQRTVAEYLYLKPRIKTAVMQLLLLRSTIG